MIRERFLVGEYTYRRTYERKKLFKNTLIPILTLCLFFALSNIVQAENKHGKIDEEAILGQEENLQLLTNEEYNALMGKGAVNISNITDNTVEDFGYLIDTDKKIPIASNELNDSSISEGISALSA